MPFGLPGPLVAALLVLGGVFAGYSVGHYAEFATGGDSESLVDALQQFRSEVLERIRDLEVAHDRLQQETEAKLDKIRAAENRLHHKMDRVQEREEALVAAEEAEGQAAVEEMIAQNMEEGAEPAPEGPEELDPEVAAFMARRQ